MTTAAKTFKLEELAAAAGVSARTVRYYVQRGLLPAPAFRGRDTVYDEDHLLRLQAIRRLQEQFLPLDAIQVELARRGREELRALAIGKVEIAPPAPPAPPPERWQRFDLGPGVTLFAAERVGIDEELAMELSSIIERRKTRGWKKT